METSLASLRNSNVQLKTIKIQGVSGLPTARLKAVAQRKVLNGYQPMIAADEMPPFTPRPPKCRYNRHESLDVGGQSMYEEDEDPSAPEVVTGSEKHSPHITTTSTKSKRQLIVVGDTLLRATEGPIC